MLILILDNLRSAHNVGSLFRTADGAGVEQIYLVGITPVPAEPGRLYLSLAEKALKKTSLGAEQAVPWKYVKSLPTLIRRLQKEGVEVAALEQSPDSILHQTWRPKRSAVALIVGNEVDGVNERILKRCDVILEIPMHGMKNSLNVSVAGGIALYHLSATIEKRMKRG